MSSPAEPAQRVLIVRREQLQAARAGRHRQATRRWWKEPKLWLCSDWESTRALAAGGGVRLRHRKGRQAWGEILRSSATPSQSHFLATLCCKHSGSLADDSNCSLHRLTSNQSQSALSILFSQSICKHPNGRGQPTARDSRSALALQLHRPSRFFPGRLLLQAARKARQRVIKNRAKQTISPANHDARP